MDRKRQRLSPSEDNVEKGELVERVTYLEQELVKKESQHNEEKAHFVEQVLFLEQELAKKEAELNLSNAENLHLVQRVTVLEKERKNEEDKFNNVQKDCEGVSNWLTAPIVIKDNPKLEEIDKYMKRIEEILAHVGAQFNLNNTINEEELEKLKPEFEKLRTSLKLGKDQLLMENAQLEQFQKQTKCLLKENKRLLKQRRKLFIKAKKLKRRFKRAEDKFVDFSNEVNNTNDTTQNFISLPEDVVIEIFSYLNQNELGLIARVCRSWNVLAKTPILWKVVDVELHVGGSPLSQNTVANRFVSSLPACVTRMRLNFQYCDVEFESLIFEEMCMSLSEKCPRIETLIFFNAVTSESFESVMDLSAEFLHEVKTLMFRRSLFSGYLERRELSRTSNRNLKELYICDTDSFLQLRMKDLKDCDYTLLNSAFPKLETICLGGSDITCGNVISLISSHQSLKNIYVDEDVARAYARHPYSVANKDKLEIVKVIVECFNLRPRPSIHLHDI